MPTYAVPSRPPDAHIATWRVQASCGCVHYGDRLNWCTHDKEFYFDSWILPENLNSYLQNIKDGKNKFKRFYDTRAAAARTTQAVTTNEPTNTPKGTKPVANDLMRLADQTSATSQEFLDQLLFHSKTQIDTKRAEMDAKIAMERRVEGVLATYTNRAQDALANVWNRCSYVPPKTMLFGASKRAVRSHNFERMVEEQGHNQTFCTICDMPQDKTRQKTAAMHLARKLMEKDIDVGALLLSEKEAEHLEWLWGRAYPTGAAKLEQTTSFSKRVAGAMRDQTARAAKAGAKAAAAAVKV
ncbi:MAG: hypothetical protein KGL39_25030 [Patescibacteria group bacterium]|nr:hypothetical protein [Patescibacteria group bacterium]